MNKREAHARPIEERRRIAHDGIADALIWAAKLIGLDQPDGQQIAEVAERYRRGGRRAPSRRTPGRWKRADA
jgi:hypothetical protein